MNSPLAASSELHRYANIPMLLEKEGHPTEVTLASIQPVGVVLCTKNHKNKVVSVKVLLCDASGHLIFKGYKLEDTNE